jgi:hypothetical protein
MSLSNNIISFIIMILIPLISLHGINLLVSTDYKIDSPIHKKNYQIKSAIQLFIGIIILFYSLYFNTKIWGIPVGGGIIIIGSILNRWRYYNEYIQFFILLSLLVLLILFLKFKKPKTNIKIE